MRFQRTVARQGVAIFCNETDIILQIPEWEWCACRVIERFYIRQLLGRIFRVISGIRGGSAAMPQESPRWAVIS